MSFAVEKFPDLEQDGRRVIWDSRQTPDGRPEVVFIPSDLSDDLKKVLRARSNAIFVEPDARTRLGEAAAAALNHPSTKIRVLAVTGTNGKTTCVSLLRHLLVGQGLATVEIGTLGVSLHRPQREVIRLETGFTTPEAPTLHHILHQAVAQGFDCVVMEASSHGIELGRIAGVDFDGAVFTNLSQDHLDFHGTMAAYEAAKTRLFTELLPRADSLKKKFVVVNTADPAGAPIFRAVSSGIDRFEYRLDGNFGIEENSLAGLRVRVGASEILKSPLVGAYNAENIVASFFAAAALLERRGAPSPRAGLMASLENFTGAAGRLERVPGPSAAGFVFVDYAHTPDALEKVLSTLKSCKGTGRLSVVFGCGGDRDRGKRPQMGAIAVRWADAVILTSDNPRSEDPDSILTEIENGIPAEERARVRRIGDRALAIETALGGLGPRDVCVVAGKGHENVQIVGDEKRPFSDVEVCARALQRRAV